MSVDIQDLSIAIGGATIVDHVTLNIGDGERVGLVGSSGSGKSMISKTLLGLLPVGATVRGDIRLGKTTLANSSGYVIGEREFADLRGRSVGMIFQNPGASLNPVSTVGEQVALPLKLHYDLTKAEREERVHAMLAKVGLTDEVFKAYPSQLSGGQCQRVGIATALITSPRFIIADEPTTALDSLTQRSIVDLLVSLVDEAGASMLFITHDFAVLSRATTRSYVLDHGVIVESGQTADLLSKPQTVPAQTLVNAARELTLHTKSEVTR